jgi:hypothetical protein
MNTPFPLAARRTLNRMVSSPTRTPALRHLRASMVPTVRAPHAPYKSQYLFAFEELRATLGGPSPVSDVRKSVQLQTFDGQVSVLKAAHSDQNPACKAASLRVYRKLSSDRIRTDRVAGLTRGVGIQCRLAFVACLIQRILKHEIRAQLRFLARANDHQPRCPREASPKQIHRTIQIRRLTEAPLLPVTEKRPRSVPVGSHETTPAEQ